MNYTKEDKEWIVNEYLGMIFDISDKEYQKRVWIRGEGPEVMDYGETVCFFGDYEFVLDDYKMFDISEEGCQVLKNFYKVFCAFDDGLGGEYIFPELFIDTPEWEIVMNSAKGVLKAFNYKKS
jgi:hypothetical protein